MIVLGEEAGERQEVMERDCLFNFAACVRNGDEVPDGAKCDAYLDAAARLFLDLLVL